MSKLPKGWIETRLGEVVETANTGLDAIKRAPIVLENTGIKCFRIQDASQSKKYENWGFTKVNQKNYEKFKLLKGDILIARTGNSIGVNFLVRQNTKSVFNNGLIRLRVNNFSSFDFLYKIISSRIFDRYIQSIAYGTSTQPNMQINALLDLNINLPPLPEQKAIAKLLSSFDEKIELLQAQNETLETLAQTIFKEWFVKFNYPGSGASAPHNVSGGAKAPLPGAMVDSELGEIPEGWRVGTLRELTKKISKGTTPKKIDLINLEKGVPFLKVKDITNNGLIKLETLDEIPREIHENALRRSQLEENDILFSIAGTIGRVAILPKILNDSNCNQAIAFIRLTSKELLLEYVHQWIISQETQNEIKSNIVQGVQANVSLTVMGSLQIIIPKESILRKWAEIINPVYKRLEINISQIQTLKKTRDTLLPKLMSGAVRIPL